MDIKKEPEEDIQHVAQSASGIMDEQWRNYKDELIGNCIPFKRERSDSISKEIPVYEETTIDSEDVIVKKEVHRQTCEEENSENTFRIKIEETDDGQLRSDDREPTSRNPLSTPVVYGAEASRSLSPYFQIQIDGKINVKNELEEATNVNSVDFLTCGDNRLNSKCSGSIPQINLIRTPFYERNFVCNVCFDVFPTVAEQRFHRAVHKQSDSRIVEDYISGAHKRRQIEKEYLKCDKCDYSGRFSSDMKLHKSIHSEEKPFKCETCDYSSRLAGNLRVHKMIHSEEKPFKCSVCDYSCRQLTTMKDHRMIHSGVKPFKCEKCDYSCIQSYAMKRHKLIHSDDKPFKCDECDYSTRQLQWLNVHKRIHSGEKPFKCYKCDYSCRQLNTMKGHKMIHSGEKPFKCDTCDYSCIQSNALKRHKLVHTEDKPYKCDECDYSTRQRKCFNAHKKTHSGE